MPSARAYHHGNLRSALLERAQRTVRERGVQALSLRELARDAGVSHGAPRRHFPDRDALLDALAMSGFERLGRELERAVRAAGPGAEARLHALAQAYVAFATTDAALLELMFATKHREGAEDVLAEADRSLAIALAVVASAQLSGDLVAGDAQQITQFVFATVHGLATMANGGMLGGDDVRAVVADAIERLLDGLRPRGDPERV
jgi:AcrR family transcriptional regulator